MLALCKSLCLKINFSKWGEHQLSLTLWRSFTSFLAFHWLPHIQWELEPAHFSLLKHRNGRRYLITKVCVMCLGLESMESMGDNRDFLNEPPFWMNHFGEHTRITFDRPIEWYFRKLSFYVAQAGLKHPDIGNPPTSQRFKCQGPQLYVTTPDHSDFVRKQLCEAWELTELVKRPCFIYNQFHFWQLNNIPCCKHTTFSLSISYLFIIYFLFLFISWLTSRQFPFAGYLLWVELTWTWMSRYLCGRMQSPLCPIAVPYFWKTLHWFP